MKTLSGTKPDEEESGAIQLTPTGTNLGKHWGTGQKNEGNGRFIVESLPQVMTH